jgi:hypothetical protein
MTSRPSHISAVLFTGAADSTAVMDAMPSAHASSEATLLVTRASKSTGAAHPPTSVMGLSAKVSRAAQTPLVSTHSSLLVSAVMVTTTWAAAHTAAHAGRSIVHAAAIAALLVVLLRWVGVVVFMVVLLGVFVQDLLFELVKETHGDVIIEFDVKYLCSLVQTEQFIGVGF